MKALSVATVMMAGFVLACVPGRAASEDFLSGCETASGPVKSYVCGREGLAREMEAITLRYHQLTRNEDAEIRFLARWDRHFFVLALETCRNARIMEVCARERVLEKGQALSLPVTRDLLIGEIKSGGILSPELVARYPTALAGVDAEFPGTLSAMQPKGAALIGTFHGMGRKGGDYPAVLPKASAEARAFFARHATDTDWYRGRVVKRGHQLVLVLDQQNFAD